MSAMKRIWEELDYPSLEERPSGLTTTETRPEFRCPQCDNTDPEHLIPLAAIEGWWTCTGCGFTASGFHFRGKEECCHSPGKVNPPESKPEDVEEKHRAGLDTFLKGVFG